MQKQQEINVELPEEIAEGIYSNLAIITHSNSEFILDFIRLVPNVAQAKVKSRLILTPQHAKRLYAALGDNIRRYEEAFGTIKIVDNGNPPFPMNFGGPTGQA
jgi:predicted transcriptional regulator